MSCRHDRGRVKYACAPYGEFLRLGSDLPRVSTTIFDMPVDGNDETALQYMYSNDLGGIECST